MIKYGNSIRTTPSKVIQVTVRFIVQQSKLKHLL